MKNTLERVNSREGDTEECIRELENRIEVTQSEQEKEIYILKNEYILGMVWTTSSIQTFSL